MYLLEGEGCGSYAINTDSDRSVRNKSVSGLQKCDSALAKGWYRFNGIAGSRIPHYCVTQLMCNTHAPGWLNGTHPTPQEGVVNRTVCFHWNSNCCNWNSTIMVRNCGSFYVYKLQPPGYCYLRFCVTDAWHWFTCEDKFVSSDFGSDEYLKNVNTLIWLRHALSSGLCCF